MSVIEKSIDVEVPLSVAYNQWTQFEEFPRFMEGVEEVRQLDDATLHWRVSISGTERTFDARIEEQEPDRRIAWRATGGERQAGEVVFQPVDESRTRVHLKITYEPERWTEKVADALRLLDRRVEGDLRRFKRFIEERGDATGAWRGRVEHGRVAPGDTGGAEPPRSTESGGVGPELGDGPPAGGPGGASTGGEPHERE